MPYNESDTRAKLIDPPIAGADGRTPGAFVNAGAGVKTNLLFFSRGGPTERIWY